MLCNRFSRSPQASLHSCFCAFAFRCSLCLEFPFSTLVSPSSHPWPTCFHEAFFDLCFHSVTQSCPTICDPMNCSTPGLPVHHQLLELAQTHLHQVSDTIQPSHPLSFPSPALSLSQHQGLWSPHLQSQRDDLISLNLKALGEISTHQNSVSHWTFQQKPMIEICTSASSERLSLSKTLLEWKGVLPVACSGT